MTPATIAEHVAFNQTISAPLPSPANRTRSPARLSHPRNRACTPGAFAVIWGAAEGRRFNDLSCLLPPAKILRHPVRAEACGGGHEHRNSPLPRAADTCYDGGDSPLDALCSSKWQQPTRDERALYRGILRFGDDPNNSSHVRQGRS